MRDINHYETLEVRDFASPEVIKGAHRHLCQRWHPDKNPDDRVAATKRTAAINGAFHVLGNPILKAEFDAQLRQQQVYANPANSPPPPPATPPHAASQPPPQGPSPQSVRSEKVDPGMTAPGRGRLYVYLYGLTMTLCIVVHFDLAGLAVNTPLLILGVLGMGVALLIGNTETAVRVVFVTFAFCLLAAIVSWLNAFPGAALPVGTSTKGSPETAPVTASTTASPTANATSSSVEEAIPQAPAASIEDALPPDRSADASTESPPVPAAQAAEPAQSAVHEQSEDVAPGPLPIPNHIAEVKLAPLHYPPQAVRQRHEGTAMLAVVVDESGHVTSISLSQSSGYGELDREAVRARPVYVVPAYEGGKAKSTVVSLPVKFNLSDTTY